MKNHAISPIDAAGKLATSASLKDIALADYLTKAPRHRELIWFIQAMSARPGGLDQFSAACVNEFAEQFVPECLRQGNTVSMEQRRELWSRFPLEIKASLIPCKLWADDWRERDDGLGGMEYLYGYLSCRTEGQLKAFNSLLRQLDVCELRDAFTREAKATLPRLLRAICDPQIEWAPPEPWFCPQLLSVLTEAMDSHAVREKAKIGDTETSRAIFENLDRAYSSGLCVALEGKSRSGKTKAAETHAAAYPGRCRLIVAQPGYAMRDLYAALAAGLGLAFPPDTPSRKIKAEVEYVLHHCGRLLIVIDEAHRLLGAPPSANAMPMRLEYLRANTMDLHLAVALITTPQFSDSVSRWHRKTGWNFGQWTGRIDLPVSLPGNSSYEDVLAVVKNYGPRIPEKWQQYIARVIGANAATRREHESRSFSGYLYQVRAICCMIERNSNEAGRIEPNESDILGAIGKVIPVKTAPVSEDPAPVGAESPERLQSPVAVKRGRLAAPSTTSAPALETLSPRQTSPTAAPALEMPSERATTPLMETV